MKPLLSILTLVSLSLACQHHLVFKGWQIDPKSVISDSVMIDGKLEPTMKAVVYGNFVCPDSSIAARKDSVEKKGKKP